jgi:dCMP deaminase
MIISGENSMKNKWDERYMGLAKEVATWSKDPSSKIGAITVGSKGQVLSQGYNGFPRGVRDDLAPRWEIREFKYKFVVHAEMNAIYNATYNGVSLDGATIYVHGLPCCHECAKGIIQVGVKRVVMNGDPEDPRWKESAALAIQMFKESKVEYEFI